MSNRRYYCSILIGLAVVLIALHWVHIGADPAHRLGLVKATNHSTDLYTDEGWDSQGAIAAARFGHWYQPGQFNLSVDGPMWSAILHLFFHATGINLALARSLQVAFFACSVLLFHLFVRQWLPAPDPVAPWTTLLLSSNFLAFTFSRMSILESVWTLFMVAALLLITLACRHTSMLLSFLAGLCLACALLTKFTALFAIMPMLAILLLFPPDARRRLRLAVASAAGVLALMLPFVYIVSTHYRADHEYYRQVNVVARAVHTPFAWARSVAVVLASVRYFDIPLCLAFLTGLFLFFLVRRADLRNAHKQHPLVIIFVLWLVGNLLIASTITYHPARYDLNPLFPFAALAVLFAESLRRTSAKVGLALYGLLALAVAFGMVSMTKQLLRPRYSLQATANSIAAAGADDPSALLMGDCAYTLALRANIRPMDDMLGQTPRAARITALSPKYYVTIGEPTDDRLQDFAATGRKLHLLETYDALGDYSYGRRLYLYQVQEAH